jgi:hypothetical protein
VGRDADLVVWDPERMFMITPELIAHRHKTTPYLGATLHGVVKGVWVGGRWTAAEPTLRPAGLAAGEFVVPDDFDDPLPDDLLDAFEGR